MSTLFQATETAHAFTVASFNNLAEADTLCCIACGDDWASHGWPERNEWRVVDNPDEVTMVAA